MQSPPEEKSIVELENEINQKLKDNSGLGIQSTRFYQQYAVEKSLFQWLKKCRLCDDG